MVDIPPVGGHAEAISLAVRLYEVLGQIRLDTPGRPDATFIDLFGRQLLALRDQILHDWELQYMKVATRRPVVVIFHDEREPWPFAVTDGETIDP
jgi:hypothetical protein